jgi:large subunit ribosomal protein L29
MKIKEIRDLGINELNQKNSEILEELFRLKIRHASGQLESPATLARLQHGAEGKGGCDLTWLFKETSARSRA